MSYNVLLHILSSTSIILKMKLEIKIKVSFSEAFGYFLRALRYDNLNFLIEDFALPKLLSKKKYLTPTSLSEFKESSFSFVVFPIAFLTFIYYWFIFSKNIKKIAGWLKDNNRIISQAAVKIPDYTKYAWSQDEIKIYPAVGEWAATHNGKIYVGIRPSSFIDNPNIDIIIHEIIHANASEKARKEIGSQLLNWDLADELAAVILTRRVQKELFNSSNDKLQPLPIPFRNMKLENKLQSLQNIAARGISFANLLIYCDKELPIN